METIYVLVSVSSGKLEDVLGAARKIEGVKEAHAVTGRYDIIIKMEGRNLAALLNTVVKEIRKIGGIEDTESLIAVDL
ncbi:MAG: AsnC family transcriptional regulator [Thermoplasmata archaeon HGW-Thermoplasmata-2]|nr:MAG: AsnC family transcriptional regulator [Thermoplasmata archaeon HGW-Thermoplasmata-2]